MIKFIYININQFKEIPQMVNLPEEVDTETSVMEVSHSNFDSEKQCQSSTNNKIKVKKAK